jgi:hypothetical protein
MMIIFDDAEVISTYPLDQAIEDGILAASPLSQPPISIVRSALPGSWRSGTSMSTGRKPLCQHCRKKTVSSKDSG